MSSPNSQDERLVRVETMLTHLQHDIEQLNAALTDHFRRLQSFEDRFQRIEHDLESLADGPEERDPQSEKPPHY